MPSTDAAPASWADNAPHRRLAVRLSLRMRVVLFTLAILLPAIAAAFWIIAANIARSRATVEERLLDTTRALAMVVDRELERRASIVQVLAAAPQLQDHDFEGFAELARSALQGSSAPVAILGRDGIYFSTVPGATNNGRPQKMASFAAFSERGVQLSDLFVGGKTRQRQMVFTTPVEINGQLFNVSMGMLPAEMQMLLDSQQLPEGWAASIVNRQGTILAWSPDPQRYVGARANPRVLEQVRAEGEGYFRSSNRRGEPTLVFFSTQSRFGMSYRLAVPTAVLEADTRSAALHGSAVAALLLAVSIFLAVAVARHVVRPIEALRAAAADLEGGHAVRAPASGIPEIREVGVALARAGERIRNSNEAMQRQVAEAVASTERAQRKLAQGQRLEAIGRLAAGVAHDFNNLLQTLGTGLHLLQAQGPDARSRPYIESGQRAVKRAAALVQRLLGLGRSGPLNLQPVDLREQVPALEALLSTALPPGIHLALQVPADLWAFQTDPDQFEVALLNLVLNARDAMGPEGELRIRARNESAGSGDSVCVEVADSGAGIDPADLPRLFEPFFTTKPVGQGTGLGLVQVKDLVEQSGGRIEVASRPGAGTTVRLWLPRDLPPNDATAAPGVPRATAAAASSRGLRLLFVEDDALAADVVCTALRSSGLQVTLTRNADEALALLRGGSSFDAVLTDIVMPGSLDGRALATVLAGEFPQLRVILASGFAGAGEEWQGLPVLAKPYSVESLLTILLQGRARDD
ncbi:MAG: hypothetical protein RL026_1925 [Pseudomonadota bacterium]